VAAGVSLVQVGGGVRTELTFGGLPGLPLRLAQEPLGAVLSLTVAVVATCVFVYCVGYMHGEPDQVRFFAELSFFVAAMQALVLAGDWLLFLAAWELIGFASYLLIGFWFERHAVPAAATRAFLTTRSADLGLYLGVFLLVTASGTTRIPDTLQVGGPAALAASLLLVVATIGKSAQVPLHGWLQDAMLGPTPVSALLHSATLVAAGAILLVRVSPMLPMPALAVLGVVGGVTILVTGLMAMLQRDLKRVLASSTSSQLGYMLLAVSAGAAPAALIHLVAHAAMKSALFLGAGVFQHAYATTELNGLRGSGRRLVWTFVLFAVAGLALAGVPPLAGFWSKDAIEAAALASPWPAILGSVAFIGTALTGMYVARLLRLLWYGDAIATHVAGLAWMMSGLVVLAVVSAVLGPVLGPLARFLGAELSENTTAAIVGVTATSGGFMVGWFTPVERWLNPLSAQGEKGFRLGDGWVEVARAALATARGPLQSVDAMMYASTLAVGRFALGLAWISRQLDEHGIDAFIAELVRTIRALGERARRLQSGFVFRELAFAAGGALALTVLLLAAR
jgi:NADH-quinone oxidoreductase subunit L